MKKRHYRWPFLLLVVTGAVHGLAWWVKARGFWPGADWLVLGSGLLLLGPVARLAIRLVASPRPLPMD